jgi:prepilin-type N-terminal cleavage/methylation domain-containing protein
MLKRIMNNTHTSSKGFTLIEIMVSVAIFSIIITVGMGAVVSILNTYGISKKEKQVYESLNYSIESMTREIRLGKNFHANPNLNGSSQGSLNDVAFSDDETSFGFDATDGRGYVIFYLDNGTLFARRSGATNTRLNGVQALTDPDQVEITRLRFTVIGTTPRSAPTPNYQQPLVWLQIQAKVPGQDRLSTIQTFISQRILDIN